MSTPARRYPGRSVFPDDGLPMRNAAGDWCHRCGHVHEGVSECGVDMGNGRVCPCQLEGVPR